MKNRIPTLDEFINESLNLKKFPKTFTLVKDISLVEDKKMAPMFGKWTSNPSSNDRTNGHIKAGTKLEINKDPRNVHPKGDIVVYDYDWNENAEFSYNDLELLNDEGAIGAIKESNSILEGEVPLDKYEVTWRKQPKDLFGLIFKYYEDYYGGHSGITDDIEKFLNINKISKATVYAASDTRDSLNNYTAAVNILKQKAKLIDDMVDTWDEKVDVSYWTIGKFKYVHLLNTKTGKGVVFEIT